MDEDYDKEPFRNRLRVESINMPESMFPPVGSFPNDGFDANSPISVINRHHCIGFSIGKERYVFSREAVPGLFVDSVVQAMSEKPNFKERAFKIKSDWAESVVKSIFCEIFGEQSYLGNNYIGPKGKRFENDGLLEYGSMLFPIEVKSFRFNPDPVGTTETTETSFAESVSKPIQQCDRFYNEVMKEDNLLIFDSEGTLKKTVSTSDIKAIIPICVFSSEVGTYVAQRQISISSKDYGNPILINLWDLLMVLNYLQKPVLIAKYLFERSGKIVEKRIRTDDELTFLGIFCDCLSLSSSLNSISAGEMKGKISDIYLDTASFSHDIEMFYSNNEEKKPFKALTPLMNSVINEINRSDDPLVQEAGIIFLSLPKEDLCQLENRLKNKRDSNVIEPSGIRAVLTNGSQISLCFFATNFDKSYTVAFSYVYFQKNQSIADVVSFFPLDTSLPTPIAIKRSFPFSLDSNAMAIAQRIIGFTTIKHL